MKPEKHSDFYHNWLQMVAKNVVDMYQGGKYEQEVHFHTLAPVDIDGIMRKNCFFDIKWFLS